MRLILSSRMLLGTIALSTFLFSCQGNKMQKSKSGFEYQVIEADKGGAQIKEGDGVEFHAQIAFVNKQGKDSVLINTRNQGNPIEVQLRKTNSTDNIVDRRMMEVLEMLREGDSASFTIEADSIPERAPYLTTGTYIRYDFKVEKVTPASDYAKKRLVKRQETMDAIENFGFQTRMTNTAIASKDSLAIANYIAANSLTNVQSTPSGLHYIIQDPGQGELALPGFLVSVGYKGYLLDGTVFDQSQPGQPITFPTGQGKVILGWELGIAKLRKGGMAKLLVPSYLAYGPEAKGSIPANSVLVFDVRLEDLRAL